MSIEISCVELVIENEIQQGLNQSAIARSYALALKSQWKTDWARVNRAIVNRWSKAGLAHIKTLAHKLAAEV